jgi:hypothetical protein
MKVHANTLKVEEEEGKLKRLLRNSEHSYVLRVPREEAVPVWRVTLSSPVLQMERQLWERNFCSAEGGNESLRINLAYK